MEDHLLAAPDGHAHLWRSSAGRPWGCLSLRHSETGPILKQLEHVTDPQLPADIADHGAALGVTQCVRDQLAGECRGLHRPLGVV